MLCNKQSSRIKNWYEKASIEQSKNAKKNYYTQNEFKNLKVES